jgi:hypothetical protein
MQTEAERRQDREAEWSLIENRKIIKRSSSYKPDRQKRVEKEAVKLDGWDCCGGYLHVYGLPAGASAKKRAWMYKNRGKL